MITEKTTTGCCSTKGSTMDPAHRHGEHPDVTVSAKAVDPVCGMQVDPAKPAGAGRMWDMRMSRPMSGHVH